ncbi:MAG: SCO family protein [Gammaproteobacteria bacterium]|nr:SCO family protein [Gammaproteobacteria bacterium]
MRFKLLICSFLLHMMLPSDAWAISQSTAPGDSVGKTAPAFDYDQALATSQAAIGSEVGDHRFIDTDGEVLTLGQLRGKPLVLSMVYTSCYQICPMTTRHLSKIVQKARAALGDDSFTVVAIGFDTAIDTPDAMRYFAAKQGVIDQDWKLLSTDPQTIKNLSKELGFLYYPSSNGFDHLIQATIIDAGGRVYRQVYGQVFDTPMLVDPLIELVLGRKAPEQPLLANLVSKIKLFCTTYDPVRDGYYFDYSLFLGMLIGATIILVAGTVVVRGWPRN